MDFKPKKQERVRRTKPTDNILRHYDRRLKKHEFKGSINMKPDTHMAMKQISILEHKQMYEILDEAVEHYIKDTVPDSTQRLIIQNVRFLQERMPKK